MIPAFGRLRQEYHEFEVNLACLQKKVHKRSSVTSGYIGPCSKHCFHKIDSFYHKKKIDENVTSINSTKELNLKQYILQVGNNCVSKI